MLQPNLEPRPNKIIIDKMTWIESLTQKKKKVKIFYK